MPQRGKPRTGKPEIKKKQPLLTIDKIVQFLRFIGSISGAFLIISAIGLILTEKEPETVVAYVVSMVVNALVVAGMLLLPRVMKKSE